MRRRDFLGVVSGAVVAWPIPVRAQQSERVRFIGMLNALGSDDPEAQARFRIALSGDFRKTDGLAVYPDFDLKPQFSIDKLAAVSRLTAMAG